jgi:hypothetical protein
MGRDGAGARWQGYSHQELYDMLHSGPGSAAAGPVASRWSGMADALTEIQQQLNAGVAGSGATWVGVAGDSARDALGPLGDWAQQAATAADVMRVSTELQGDLLGKARAAMPAPVPMPQQPTQLGGLVTAQVDYEVAELSSQVAAQQAHQVMAEYEAATDDNVDTLGDFGEPPTLVVDTTPITGPVVRARVGEPDVVGSTSAPATTEEPIPTAEDPETLGAAEAAAPSRATATRTTPPEPTGGTAPSDVPARPTAPPPSASATPPAPTTPAAATSAAPAEAQSGTVPSSSASAGVEAGSTSLSAAAPVVAPVGSTPGRRSSDAAPSPRFGGGAIVPAARRAGDEEEQDDLVHESKYLIEADDIYGSQTYSPPVIGETPRRR